MWMKSTLDVIHIHNEKNKTWFRKKSKDILILTIYSKRWFFTFNKVQLNKNTQLGFAI